ncbi:MAG: DNA translocase FtsK, partial [Patescibacteria group bacterium]
MSRKFKKGFEKKPWVKPETKNSVIAIILIGIAVILFLASAEKAGPAGDIIYKIFSGAFGIGYYLLPISALLISVAFLFSSHKNLFGVTLIGAALFLTASLGLIDILFPEKAGLVGVVIGSTESLLGYTGSLILSATLVVSGLLLSLNASIRFGERKKEDLATIKNSGDEEKPLIIKSPEPIPAPAATENKIAKKAEGKEKEQDTDEEELIPKLKIKPGSFGSYTPPPLSLLKSTVEKPTPGDLRANANIIKRTLESFGIPVEMGEINIGPKVTRYTLKPAEGMKLSRIIALHSDMALALAAHPIRIEAPIP